MMQEYLTVHSNRLFLLACSVGALLVLNAGATRAQEAAPVAQAPKFRVGDAWKIRNHDIGNRREPVSLTSGVTSVDDKQVVFLLEDATAGKYWWLYDIAQSKYLARFDYKPDAPDQRGAKTADISKSDDMFQFPLQVGKKWSGAETWLNNAGKTDWKATVVEFSKIKTEAGEFDAYKIEYSGWWNRFEGNYTGRWSQTVWFSPEAKRRVKRVQRDWDSTGQPWNHRTEELLEFKPG